MSWCAKIVGSALLGIVLTSCFCTQSAVADPPSGDGCRPSAGAPYWGCDNDPGKHNDGHNGWD